MKNLFCGNRKKIVIISLIAIFVLVGIAIPYINSIIKSANHDIDRAIYELYEHPDIDKKSIRRFTDKMNDVTSADWKKEKFESKALDSIAKIESGKDATEFEKQVYEITAQQILLETVGYKSKALNDAYNKKVNEILEHQVKNLEFDAFLDALINEPYPTQGKDEKVYDVDLTYYTSPQTVVVSGFLNDYIAKTGEDAISSKDTNSIMSFCHKLSVLAEYPEFDIAKMADMNKIIKILTTDAEKIVVKEGQGGYYDGLSNSASSDNESDELFDYVASTITGTDVNSNSYKVKDIRYYGDLASYYFESGMAYSYEDSKGDKQSNSKENLTTRLIYLKDEIIYEGKTIDEKNIEYAYEDSMVNYRKGNNCFGISDSSLVCYVGDITFKLDY